MKYIDIEKEMIPYKFQMSINKKTYSFEINYNNEFDFFTLDIYLKDSPVFVGEKLNYNKVIPLAEKYSNDADTFIKVTDLSNRENKVTWENLNETVFLYLMGVEDLE